MRQLPHSVCSANIPLLSYFWEKETFLKGKKVSEYFVTGCRLIIAPTINKKIHTFLHTCKRSELVLVTLTLTSKLLNQFSKDAVVIIERLVCLLSLFGKFIKLD